MISVDCRDGGAWRGAVAALQAAAAAAPAAWLAGPWPALAAALVAGALAARRVPDPTRLAWDGGGWQVDGAAAAPPAVVLDLGGWMLLALGGGRWAPLSPAGAGAAWPALRAALYSTVPLPDRPAPARRP